MKVLQLSTLIFISHQPDSFYMIDTRTYTVKAINETCFDLITNLVALQKDLKALA